MEKGEASLLEDLAWLLEIGEQCRMAIGRNPYDILFLAQPKR